MDDMRAARLAAFGSVLALCLLRPCAAIEVSTATQFQNTVSKAAFAEPEVIVTDHLDLTGVMVEPFEMDSGALVSMIFPVEPLVKLIRGRCATPHTLASSQPAIMQGQCHLLVAWGHVFLVLNNRAVWIDRLYVVEQPKPSDAATLIINKAANPSIIFRALAGSKLWVTRTTAVGTTAAGAVEVGGSTENITTPGKVCISNSTLTGFSALDAGRNFFGTIGCIGHLTLENTDISQNKVPQTNTGVVDATSPSSISDLAIINMQGVSLLENIAVYEILRYGPRSRLASDNTAHSLSYYATETGLTSTVPFDILTPSEKGLLISTQSPEFTSLVQKYGWDAIAPPPPPDGQPQPDGSVTGRGAGNGTSVDDGGESRGVSSVVIGAVAGVLGVVVCVSVAIIGYVLWRKTTQQQKRDEFEFRPPPVGYNGYQPVAPGWGGHHQPHHPAGFPYKDAYGNVFQPSGPPSHYGPQGSGMSAKGSVLHTGSSGGAPVVAGPQLPSMQVQSYMSMSQHLAATDNSHDGHQPSEPLLPAMDTAIASMASSTQTPVFREGVEGIEDALDELQSKNVLFMGKYLISQGVMGRRVGGQGVVQFVQTVNPVAEYAVKFFVVKEAFQAERSLYNRDELRRMMPATREIIENADGELRTPSGYVFPPFIVIEKGQSLEEFALTLERDDDGYVTELSRLTVLQAIIFVADRLRQLHAVDVVHRDIKQSNILRLPNVHGWTLIDFGCAAHAGERVPITYSLFYTPPEVILALEAGARTIEVEKSMDAWALGIVAFESLTGMPAVPRSVTLQEACNRITGRSPMPWEGEAGRQVSKKLGRLGRTILACLDRDPTKRPTAEVVVSSWNHMFSTMTATNLTSSSGFSA